jgi:hypothetical protein
LEALSYRTIAIWPVVTAANRKGFESWAADQVLTGKVDGADLIAQNPWKISDGIFDRVNGVAVKSTGSGNSLQFPDLYVPLW